MQTYSPWHVSAVVICGAWLHRGRRTARHEGAGLAAGLEIWVLLVPRNARPARRDEHPLVPCAPQDRPRGDATLATNLQPFVAAVLAVVLLSEPLDVAQIAGGALIAGGSSSRAAEPLRRRRLESDP